jgi:hypothetical protein
MAHRTARFPSFAVFHVPEVAYAAAALADTVAVVPAPVAAPAASSTNAQILEEKHLLNYKDSKIYNRSVINTFNAFAPTVDQSV